MRAQILRNDDSYQQVNELDIDGSNEVVSEQLEMSRERPRGSTRQMIERIPEKLT